MPPAFNQWRRTVLRLSGCLQDPESGRAGADTLSKHRNANQASGGTVPAKSKFGREGCDPGATEITMSSGDEAGSVGGVVSNKIKGSAKFKQGSSKVKIEGKGAAYLGAMVGQNDDSNSNMPAGHQVAPSQVKVIVAA